jgi:DnaJ-class molecular chaperone
MSLYDMLHITRDASQGEVEAAYRSRIRQLQTEGIAVALTKALRFHENIDYAYKILSNKDTREDYDRNPEAYRGVCDQYLGF